MATHHFLFLSDAIELELLKFHARNQSERRFSLPFWSWPEVSTPITTSWETTTSSVN